LRSAETNGSRNGRPTAKNINANINSLSKSRGTLVDLVAREALSFDAVMKRRLGKERISFTAIQQMERSPAKQEEQDRQAQSGNRKDALHRILAPDLSLSAF